MPQGRALKYPTAPLLLNYARKGCPISIGQSWMRMELVVTTTQGPHVSALVPDAIEQIHQEAREKEA